MSPEEFDDWWEREGRFLPADPGRAPPDPFSQFKAVLRSSKKRADRGELEWALTAGDATTLWERCGGKCEVTGIAFDFTPAEGAYARRPFAASLDRLDNAQGYVLDNVRVVCIAVNLAMNTWGEDVLMAIAVGMFQNGRHSHVAAWRRPYVMPEDVRMVACKQNVKYTARVRDFGKETHLGTFDTVDQALEARLAWARANSSLKVIRQIYAFTKKSELLNEINVLRMA